MESTRPTPFVFRSSRDAERVIYDPSQSRERFARVQRLTGRERRYLWAWEQAEKRKRRKDA
jgi:hypothetical protein